MQRAHIDQLVQERRSYILNALEKGKHGQSQPGIISSDPIPLIDLSLQVCHHKNAIWCYIPPKPIVLLLIYNVVILLAFHFPSHAYI